jgi:Ca-activated chloride channel family protein
MRDLAAHTVKMFVSVAVLLLVIGGSSSGATTKQGGLTIIEPDGKAGPGCPLEHTSVKGEVSGFVANVKVTQVFHNPRKEKIEAVYTFPLPGKAAVNDMVMKVGDRVVKGVIKRREEARRVYEEARNKGHVASLLDQERPNIFTQSVANIMPGDKVTITITYVQVLKYEEGSFNFVFPMVVAPRFAPGRPVGKKGTGWARDTAKVPDASRVTPPVAEEGERAGHDIDLTVSIDAGVPIDKVESKLHEVDIDRKGKNKVLVSLKNKKEIPNKDFVLSYLVASDTIRSGVLTHKDGKNGYLAVIMIPPKRVKPAAIAPRELIFVVDTSGSQRGAPLQKCKETMKYIIDRMNPNDTFNFIDFSDQARMLFSSPKKNTPEYRAKALKYIESLRGQGGTQMAHAIWEALSTQPEENRLRIVTFMTDGLIANDFEIISTIKKLRGQSRWFAFGTGNSVNRFLLDNMARAGGGEADYILLNTPGEEVAKKFYERIASPVLTDIKLSFKDIALKDVYPAAVSDLWSLKPLVFKARFDEPGKGTIILKGFKGGKPYEQMLDVKLPEKETDNGALTSLWARAKVNDLMDRDLMGIQRGNPDKKIKEEIIKVALAHRIMTQFTSFVAVEETVITTSGKPVKVTVPVEMAEGVSREGVFGSANRKPARQVYMKSNMVKRKSHRLPVPFVKRGYAGQAGPPTSGWSVSMKGSHEKRGAMAPAPDMSPPTSPMTDKPAAMPSKKRSGESRVSVQKAESKKADRRVLGDYSRESEPMKQAAVDRKLSSDLLALLTMKTVPKDYSKGKVIVKNGKITVKVWLKRTTDDLLKQLKEKGLKITFKASTGKMVVGEIAVDKLKGLAAIDLVRLIEPFSASG